MIWQHIFHGFLLLFVVMSSTGVSAHRPLFSERAQAMWKHGIMQEARLLHAKVNYNITITPDSGAPVRVPVSQHVSTITYESWFGLTPHLTLQLDTNLILSKIETLGSTSIRTSGLGNTEAFLKYRFLKNDGDGTSLQCSLITGIRLPTAENAHGQSSLGVLTSYHDHANLSFLPGIAGVYESRLFYVYASLSGDLPERKNRTRQGDALLYSLSYFWRPIKLKEGSLDWAFGSELNGIAQTKDTKDSEKNPTSGGHIAFLGPSFGLAYKNLFLRGGFQYPLLSSRYATDRRACSRWMMAFSAEF